MIFLEGTKPVSGARDHPLHMVREPSPSVERKQVPPLPWDLGLGTWDLHVPPTLTLRQWRMTEHKEVPPGSVPRAGGGCECTATFSVHALQGVVLQVPAVHVRRAGTPVVPRVAVARRGLQAPIGVRVATRQGFR